MKISTFIIAAAMTVFALTSCGILGQTSGSATAAGTASSAATTAAVNGQKAGSALKALYTQYKADGKLDMSNLTNIVNLATLAQNVEGLKGQSDKSSFYKDFASGLVLGSENLIKESVSDKVTGALSSLAGKVDLSSLKEKASSVVSGAADKGNEVVQNATDIANSVSNILNLFK